MLTIEEKRARLTEIRAERNRRIGQIADLDMRLTDAPDAARDGLEERRGGLNVGVESLDQEQRELQADVEQHETRLAEVRSFAADPANRESGDGAEAGRRDEPPANRGGRLDGALRAIERNADVMTDGAAEAVEGALRRDRSGIGARYIEAVSNEDYRAAFGLLLAHPTDAQLRMTPAQAGAVRAVHEAMEQRALVEGTGSAGGFGVPFALDPTILLSSNGVQNPIRQIASSVQIATNEWKGVTSEGVTAHFVAEATEASDDSPTLAQPAIHVERAQAFVPFSIEVGQDYVGLQAELTKLLADAKDVLEAEKFLSGAGHGSNEPEGLLTALTNTQRVQTAAEKVIAITDIYALKQALPPRFAVDAEWAAAEATYDAIYRLVGGGNTTEPKLMDSRDGLLLRRPTVAWSTMSTALTTSKQKPLIIGDFDEFRIVDRIGMSVELVPHLFGANRRPTGQRGLYAYWRTGSGVLVPNAFRWLEVK
jgi:HK97 family phage major capsid protein